MNSNKFDLLKSDSSYLNPLQVVAVNLLKLNPKVKWTKWEGLDKTYEPRGYADIYGDDLTKEWSVGKVKISQIAVFTNHIAFINEEKDIGFTIQPVASNVNLLAEKIPTVIESDTLAVIALKRTSDLDDPSEIITYKTIGRSKLIEEIERILSN